MSLEKGNGACTSPLGHYFRKLQGKDAFSCENEGCDAVAGDVASKSTTPVPQDKHIQRHTSNASKSRATTLKAKKKKESKILTREERLKRVTPFQRRVYDHVQRIPAGQITTYGDIARAINCKSAIAVGQALKRNPFAAMYYERPLEEKEMVPCHRVVGATNIGGFSGQKGIESPEIRQKVELLKDEGVMTSQSGTQIKVVQRPGLMYSAEPEVRR